MQKTKKDREGRTVPQHVYEALGPRPGSRGTADQVCGTCRYYGENERRKWVCRRHAPKPFQLDRGGVISYFPAMPPDGECGDWRPQESALNSTDPRVRSYEGRALLLHERSEQVVRAESAWSAGRGATAEERNHLVHSAFARARASITLGSRAGFPHRLSGERTEESTDGLRHGLDALLSAHIAGETLESAGKDPDKRLAIARWPWLARTIWSHNNVLRNRYPRQPEILDQIQRHRAEGDEENAAYLEGVDSLFCIQSLMSSKWADLDEEARGYADSFPDVAQKLWKDHPGNAKGKALKGAGAILLAIGSLWAAYASGAAGASGSGLYGLTVSWEDTDGLEGNIVELSRLARRARRDHLESSGNWSLHPIRSD